VPETIARKGASSAAQQNKIRLEKLGDAAKIAVLFSETAS
jgi:hypothetical protein